MTLRKHLVIHDNSDILSSSSSSSLLLNSIMYKPYFNTLTLHHCDRIDSRVKFGKSVWEVKSKVRYQKVPTTDLDLSLRFLLLLLCPFIHL